MEFSITYIKSEPTLKLVHDPNITSNSINYDPVCSDNKIHVRFRDYDKAEVITGLEKKLTFLLTFIFNKEFTYNNVTREDDKISKHALSKYIWNKYMPMFLESQSVKEIQNTLRLFFSSGDILLTPKYLRKGYDNPWEQFGSISNLKYPWIKTGDRFDGSSSLSNFLSTFKVSLDTFLTDDAYYIVIDEAVAPQSINQKFVNKNKRKKEKKTKRINPVKLW